MSNNKLYYPDYMSLEEVKNMTRLFFSSDWSGHNQLPDTIDDIENYILDKHKQDYEIYLGELYIKSENEVFVMVVESLDIQRLPKCIKTIQDAKAFIDIGVKQST